jgi:tRNA U34 5-methylaminomethyl-2-thiouridine-forming methyltransferase MnmC
LEIGFGTGLNCFITFLEGRNNDLKIDYKGVEAYPVKQDEVDRLNYVVELKAISDRKIFNEMHLFSWNKRNALSSSFILLKKKEFFENIKDTNRYNLIYFDAFGAQVQPELWTAGIFKKMYQALKLNGILVTYSSKGSVRRAMQEAGFEVEKLSGPPGKRHMLRAVKY